MVGAISALLAAVMAIASTDLKRVLAYSTVSQLGFMVFSIGAGGIFQSQFHLLSHSLFKALLFLGAGAVIHPSGRGTCGPWAACPARCLLTCAVFIVGALALAGIPPVNGFWSKELILEAGQLHAPSPAYLVMLATVGLTALYSARCVWMVFFARPASEPHAHEAGPAMQAALIPLAAGTLASWLLAGPFHVPPGPHAAAAFRRPARGSKARGKSRVRSSISTGTWLAMLAVAMGVLALGSLEASLCPRPGTAGAGAQGRRGGSRV